MKEAATSSLAWKKTFDFPVINNPGVQDLRGFAKFEESTTDFKAPAYYTQRVSSRSSAATAYVEEGFKVGRFQNAADPDFVAKTVETVYKNMGSQEWVQFDRLIGTTKPFQFHVRMLMPKKYARVAMLWSQTLFPAPKALQNPSVEPDFLTLYFPDWTPVEKGWPPVSILVNPEKGINLVLGVDYVGEAKMSLLRLAMYRAKKVGGLGMHAGSKVLKVHRNGKLQDFGMLLFGLSGTGKTTLTLDDHGLKAPEGVNVLQDDIVLIDKKGHSFGTEDNFYVKTEGLTEQDQPGLYRCLMNENTVFENVFVDKETGKIDFFNSKHGTNGRALAFRKRIPNSAETIDLPKTDALIFITRRDTVVPPVAKLTRDQALAFFMLGESIETSAGDPRKAGQPKHEVGFNPFIIGLEDEEGNRFKEILVSNPNIEAYLLNTGSVGKGSDNGQAPEGKKITKSASSALLAEIAHGGIQWTKDSDWGYEVPVKVPGIANFEDYNPKNYYKPETYAKKTEELKKERRDYLAQFDELDPKAAKSF